MPPYSTHNLPDTITDIPPQASVAVYERASSGLLSAARIYDDIEPPTVSDTSAS
jgi:hypothetical protein